MLTTGLAPLLVMATRTATDIVSSGFTCQNTTAEAILEANNGTSLSNFGRVTFSNSAVTSRNGTHGAFGNAFLWNLAEPVMTGSNGQPLANVSSLSNNGGNFTLTYHESH